jgi:hypothetical protein
MVWHQRPLEDIGQGDKNQRRPTVRAHSYREGGRENHQTSQQSYEEVDDTYLNGRIGQLRLTGEIAGVGADTSHGNAE